MERTILHVDANCFYASVEAAQKPELKKYPFAVVGDVKSRKGIILTANYLAKQQFGIKTAEPVVRAIAKCPSLITVPSRFNLYMEYSQKLRSILLDYTDFVEPFGCDEAWMDVTGSARLFGTGSDIAQRIRERVKKELGITVSIGVSFNKAFAKIGSDYKKPDAVTIIQKDNFHSIIWPLPVNALLYIGRSTLQKLNLRGIYTIGDLARCDLRLVQSWLGKNGAALHHTANGLDTAPVASYFEHHPVKSISNSTTARHDLCNTEEVKTVMMVLCQSVARRARKQCLEGKTISISIRDNSLFTITRQTALDHYTCLSYEILNAAMQLFQNNYTWNKKIRSLGIGLSDFSPNNHASQISLFDDESRREKLASLEKTQDVLSEKFGSGCITRGLLMKHRELSDFNPKTKAAFTL